MILKSDSSRYDAAKKIFADFFASECLYEINISGTVKKETCNHFKHSSDEVCSKDMFLVRM